MRMLLWSCYGLKSLESVNYVKNKYIEYINIVTCRGLHVTGVIRFVPELLLWIQVTLCISYFSLYS
jgi:hypothetical protein